MHARHIVRPISTTNKQLSRYGRRCWELMAVGDENANVGPMYDRLWREETGSDRNEDMQMGMRPHAKRPCEIRYQHG